MSEMNVDGRDIEYVVINGKIYFSVEYVCHAISDMIDYSKEVEESQDFIDALEVVQQAMVDDVAAVEIDEVLSEFE